ncbi:MAG TPA: bifunctional diguanylate cyclase/phosphodiesterase, partial [Chloroflexota bacterium]
HEPDDLLHEADLAMYRAKAGGRARYEIFDTRMAERAMERLELESELRKAVERRELELTYEPVVNLSSGAIDAFEGRLGWRHPRRGLLELIEFLPVAEDTGLMVDLGAWALDQACRAAQRWQALRPGVLVEMRLSARQLDHPGLVDGVEGTLVATGLPAGCLRLSVPEASLTGDPQAVATLLDALTGLGVRVALDDVGAGVSSLASLSQLPVDTLKIGSTVGNSAGLVRASVALAAALDMTLTVRGIQHPDEAARLAAVGCRRGQGALYGAPMSAQAVEELLARAVVDLRAA